MKAFHIFSLFMVIASVQLIQGARLARNCNSKWQQNLRCYKDGVGRAAERDSSFPVPNDAQKRKLETAVDACFTRFRCTSSPIPSSLETRSRSDCFLQAKKGLQAQLQTCVKRSIDDFTMPDDPYDPTNDWNYRVTSVQNVLKSLFLPQCKNVKKADLQSCVQANSYDFVSKRPPNKIPSYACQVDADCWYNWGADCQNTWEFQVIPVLCQCSQEMTRAKAVINAQNQYKTCMTQKGVTPPKDDPVVKWIDTYMKGQCTNAQSNPCKREHDAASKRIASG